MRREGKGNKLPASQWEFQGNKRHAHQASVCYIVSGMQTQRDIRERETQSAAAFSLFATDGNDDDDGSVCVCVFGDRCSSPACDSCLCVTSACLVTRFLWHSLFRRKQITRNSKLPENWGQPFLSKSSSSSSSLYVEFFPFSLCLLFAPFLLGGKFSRIQRRGRGRNGWESISL